MPCYKRYKDLESIKFNEKIIDENDEEGGWVDAHLNESSKDNDDKVQEIELGEEAIEQSLKPKSIPSQTETLEEEDDDSEAEDIEKYMQRQNVCDENDKVDKLVWGSLISKFLLFASSVFISKIKLIQI